MKKTVELNAHSGRGSGGGEMAMIVGQYERGGDNPEKAQMSERQPLQVDGRGRQEGLGATAAVLGFRIEEAPVLGQTLRPQGLGSGALQDFVLGVVPKATEWDRRADRLGLRRDHGMDFLPAP
ncbi:hypothetical protein IVB02_03230 [Bradyrhizobium sp. 166]|nr:hypothetical protein [Bradyrhizobium sp. 166]